MQQQSDERMKGGRPLPGMLLAAAILASGLGHSLPATAAELFRYINDEGVVVISSNLPPRYASRGYTVIDSRGRVLREIPRQLSVEEVQARQAEELAREEERQAEERRRAQDAELLRLYSSPEEVTRARDRRIDSIESHIASVRASMARVRSQQSGLESQAAELERAGRPVPEHIVVAIQRSETQLEEREREIRQRQEEIERTRDSFDRDRARLARLLGVVDREEAEEDEALADGS